MAKVEIHAFETVEYCQTVEVPNDQISYLEGMSSQDIIDRYIDRSCISKYSRAEVYDTRIVTLNPNNLS